MPLSTGSRSSKPLLLLVLLLRSGPLTNVNAQTILDITKFSGSKTPQTHFPLHCVAFNCHLPHYHHHRSLFLVFVCLFSISSIIIIILLMMGAEHG
jgi:hypothetical protein